MLDKIKSLHSGGKTSIVGTSNSDITMYKDLSDYHSNVHKRNPADSLPYICPEKQQLQKKPCNDPLSSKNCTCPNFMRRHSEKKNTRDCSGMLGVEY
jgi:hypothetical protein